MPLKTGKSKATFASNIKEFRSGETFKHTAKKFGKERARKQSIAVAFAQRRKSKK